VLLFLGARLWENNSGTVVPGRIYRSAQMPASDLARAIRGQHIRTVLNLRGPNPQQTWYRSEREATLAAGASHVDFQMASNLWLSRAQAKTLLDVLDRCDYPILVHCQWGAERTGLVSAVTELLRPGGSLASARRQFSAYYLYVPAGDGVVMEGHLDRYERWLHSQRLEHSPARFRHWLADVYQPGHPSRDDWPFDPYPLVIVSRPETQTTRREEDSPQRHKGHEDGKLKK
jgi:protein tyrosine phosphatase (PTP) superfamily phosphohydrolase (DUF442 family)